MHFKNYLPSLSGEKHQLFVGKKNIQLSGGIIIVLTFLLIKKLNIEFYHLFLFTIFLIGFLSDLKIITSPRVRFFLQVFSIFLFVIFFNFEISQVRIFFIDYLLEYQFFSYFFVIFCLLIIVNGTNFIDGLNGLVLGYFISILIIVYNLKLFENLNVTQFEILYFIELLFFLLLFNFFNKLYIGDGGSYLLGFGFGIYLITIYESNAHMSPFFIVLLLFCRVGSDLLKTLLFRMILLDGIFFFLIKKYEIKFFSNEKTLKILLTNIVTIYLINFNLFSPMSKLIKISMVEKISKKVVVEKRIILFEK